MVINGLDDPQKDGLGQIMALIHFYFKEEPSSIDRIALLWGRLQFALQFEGKMQKQEIKIIG